MWERSLDPGQEAEIARWMQEFAAQPAGEPPSFTAAAIWQKAELLRRWDAQRQAAAPIDVGERVQVGVGLAGAVGLLIWLSQHLPDSAASSPTLVAAFAGTTLLLASAAVFTVWALAKD
jgi:hypothetical protein